MQGTLFAGEGLSPCHLCRWARIFMYPIAWVSLMALWKRRTDGIWYIRNISYAGVLLELYHYTLQKTSWLDFMSMDTFCTKANPCAASQQVNYFGVVTIPFLCLTAFVVIAVAATVYLRQQKKQHTVTA
jgi:disulfide bond formation protein DsbB